MTPISVDNTIFGSFSQDGPYFIDYFDTLALMFRNGTDEEIINIIEKYPIKFSNVLFQNHGEALDAFELFILRSYRYLIWPKLLNLGFSLDALIPPKHLRLYRPATRREHLTPTTAGSRTPLNDHINSNTYTTGISDPLRCSEDQSEIDISNTHSYHRHDDSSETKESLRPDTVIFVDRAELCHSGCISLIEAACQLSRDHIFNFMVDYIIESRNRPDHISSNVRGINDAMHEACKRGSSSMLRYVLNNDANSNYERNGFYPIHLAVTSGREVIAKVKLLVKNGANLNVTCPRMDNATALLLATQNGDFDLVKLLLESSADPNVMAPTLGLPTPLFHSVYWGNELLVYLICELGNPDLTICNQSDESIFKIAENALIFSRAKKPGHISRLPLPKTSEAVCVRIIDVLNTCQRKQDQEATTLSLSSFLLPRKASNTQCECCQDRLDSRSLQFDVAQKYFQQLQPTTAVLSDSRSSWVIATCTRSAKSLVHFIQKRPDESKMEPTLDVNELVDKNHAIVENGPWELLCLKPIMYKVLPS